MKNTVYALSTPVGNGISVIRISGKEALDSLKKIFSRKVDWLTHTMYYGKIIDKENEIMIDEVFAVFFKAPKSYTGEDCVEIHCHGSNIIVSQILQLLSKIGLKYAKEGEFSKRAFLNGRLSLSQAEAVMDLINASASSSAKHALEQLEGSVSKKIISLQDQTTDCIAQIEAQIDYPDEILIEDLQAVYKNIDQIEIKIRALISSANQGIMLREGIKVVIAGKPNAGKSSIFNALVGYSRAIVTNVAGTTRDSLEEKITLFGLPVVLIDTAGLRASTDAVEKIGIEVAHNKILQADLVVYVVDKSAMQIEHEWDLILQTGTKLVVFSKNDLCNDKLDDVIAKLTLVGIDSVESSSFLENGVESLKKAILEHFNKKKPEENAGATITNARHLQALQQAASCFQSAKTAFNKNNLDCVTIDLRAAWHSLGEITGETIDEAVVDRIFSKFCLGK